MEKYKRQDVSPIEKENERDENYKGSNSQIDSERTSDNYHLIYPQGKYIERQVHRYDKQAAFYSHFETQDTL